MLTSVNAYQYFLEEHKIKKNILQTTINNAQQAYARYLHPMYAITQFTQQKNLWTKLNNESNHAQLQAV